MRMFRKPGPKSMLAEEKNRTQPVYRCQSDGMIGLGCGARSYTKELHFSTEFAVGRQGVHSILLDYINREPASFAKARYGIELSRNDQQRRFAILGLLQTVGLLRSDYQSRFGHDVLDDLPELSCLPEHDLATVTDEKICLTQRGMERSDAVGPWLYSEHVCELMQDFELV